jgi:hypothetical protein
MTKKSKRLMNWANRKRRRRISEIGLDTARIRDTIMTSANRKYLGGR